MGLWEGIKRSLNIGGARVEIFTASQQFNQGGEVRGRILVSCGSYAISGKSIGIYLEEFWQETRGTGKNRHTVTVRQAWDSMSFVKNFTLEPETEYTYEFVLRLPLNSRLSASSAGWSLLVKVDVPNAVDPEKRVILKIAPAKEILAVSQSCQDSLNMKEKKNSWKWIHSSYSTYFRMLPPEDLKKEFDYIAFELKQSGNGGVEGTVIFNLQEKFLKDYFKAIVGMDNLTNRINISRDELFKADGSLRSGAISSKLRPLIQKIITDRDPYSKTY